MRAQGESSSSGVLKGKFCKKKRASLFAASYKQLLLFSSLFSLTSSTLNQTFSTSSTTTTTRTSFKQQQQQRQPQYNSNNRQESLMAASQRIHQQQYHQHKPLTVAIDRAPHALSESGPQFERWIERMEVKGPAKRLSDFSLSQTAGSWLTTAQHTAEQAQQQQQQQTNGDANNKTTMRFFRNNKTFASIVYTKQTLKTNQHRRLINCHLVDLEKHSADVMLFEHKYDLKTTDVEFREMMQLIESCTNIARSKQIRPNHHQLINSLQNSTIYPRPLLVVGRPIAPITTTPNEQLISATKTTAEQQQQLNSLVGFRQVMGSALNKELKSLGSAATLDDSTKLDLPVVTTATTTNSQRIQKRRLSVVTNNQVIVANNNNNNNNNNNQPTKPLAINHYPPISQTLAKVGETGKRLVLGEVTPPTDLIEGRNGGIREALQEITAYDTSDLLAIWRGILPGTNWCGMGDRASSYNDLGFESDIDICCRAHDFCPIRLSAFSSGYGLFNWSFYTRSHCNCDQNFLDCLQRAESPLASVVMKFYFTIMKTTCLHDNETSVVASATRFSGSAGSGKQTQQQEVPLGGDARLLDQIRANMPLVPALSRSRPLNQAG